MAAICEAMAPASPNGNPLRMMAEQRGGNPCNPHGEHTPGHQWPKPPPNTAVHRLLTSSPAQPRASSSPPRSLLPIRATRATATRTHRRQRHRGDKQARQWPSGPDRAQTGPTRRRTLSNHSARAPSPDSTAGSPALPSMLPLLPRRPTALRRQIHSPTSASPLLRSQRCHRVGLLALRLRRAGRRHRRRRRRQRPEGGAGRWSWF
jgi:hypothetical protein